jgi:hypothetical protein
MDEMQCKQCRGENEERATQCGFCDAVLRRPYPYDPLGEWIASLERDVQRKISTPLSRALELFVLVVVVVASPIGLTLLAQWLGIVPPGWVSTALFGLGMMCVAVAVRGFVPKSRPRHVDYVDQIDEYRRTAGIEPWRMIVLVAESMPKRSLVRAHILDTIAARRADG